jgi:release factor glutamine methyltransferase
MNLKKTNVLSFIQLSSLYKTKYHLPNQKILLQIIYSCSHLVNSLATFTQYRNQPIDFSIKELEKQIKLYQEHKPIELINQAPITFLNTKISVANQVFIPRVETEFVVNQAISLIKQHHFHHVFDLCCGSGAIGISIKKSVPTCTVTSVDINQQCILCTKRNAKANQTSIKAVCGDFIKTMINSKTKADIIVCNPPYVAKKDLCQQYFQYENKISFNNSADELYFYKTIIENIDRICNQKHFSIVFEIGYNQKQPLLKFLKTTP